MISGAVLAGRIGGALAAAALLGALVAPPAMAHFRLNTNIRIFHLERLDDGLRLYLRMPTPLVYSHYLARVAAPDQAIEAPYIVSAEEDGRRVHRIDVAALEAESLGFARLVAAGYRVVIDGREVAPEVEAVVVYPASLQPRFAARAEAQASLEGPVYPPGSPPAFVGDSVTDLQVFYRSDGAEGEIRISGVVPEGFAPAGFIANVFLDEVAGERQITRATGLLAEPVILNTSVLTAASSFVEQGIWHILEGADHLLFVLCLVIGATTFGGLLWRVTGFTIGHTVTLIAGFLGYTPSGPWFIPGVETAIALSIVYAGAIAVLNRSGASALPVTAAIGLLHGFGFSFVLSDMLSLEAPHLLISLISFNVGVEIGQIGIVLAVWPALFLLGRRLGGARRVTVVATASLAMAVALYWTFERVVALTAILSA